MTPRRGPAGPAWIVALVIGAVGSACGSSRPAEVEVAPAPVTVVPAGVDTSVAEYADSLAAESFVDVPQQEQAAELLEAGRVMAERTDSLWAMFDAVDSVRVVSPEDSAAALEATAEGGQALVELDRVLRETDLDPDALARRTAILLDSAEAALETAYRLNPFDSRSKLWLSRVYELQARRLGQAAAYQLAIDELEKLVRLTPDQHAVFAMLANNYYRLEQWAPAADNYRRAEAVYLETFDLAPDPPDQLDSALVFTYVRARADMHVRLFDAPPAVAAYERALEYAPSGEDSAFVDGELEWMAWDDLNIASSVARDSLAAIEQAGDLEAAQAGYRVLLPQLSAQGAIDEIDWRLAIVDYNLGAAEPAADRLHGLVQRTAMDSAGYPVDSTYARYLEDYGTLCLNLGRSFLYDQKDNRTALKYFTQATRIAWAGRPVAYLEIALLLQGNTNGALEHANRALAGEDALTVDQRRELYRLLMSLHRRLGDFEQARRFRDAYRALGGP